MELIVELIKLLCVRILSGIFAAVIALRKYRHEKWWEMRVSAYREAIETLSDLTANYQRQRNHWNHSNEVLKSEVIIAEIESARSKIRKLRDMGAFIFSKKAEKALTDFDKLSIPEEMFDNDPELYMDFYLSAISETSKKSLQELVLVSRKDLKITNNWL